MYPLIRATLIFLIAFGSLGLTTVPIFADEAAEEAAKRVNLAGRQRMLSQRIAMSACFVSIGVDSNAHFARLESAYIEFTRANDALRNGSDELGLHQEGYRTILEELDDVDATWADYQSMLDGFMQIKLMTQDDMSRFNASSLNVLTDMNVAVTTIASKYSADLDALPQILALTIDFAGRQRMLTQKMAKEFCLISAGIDVEENREMLMQSNEQFNLTLDALVNGIPHLITPAPTPEILAHLQEVKGVWEQPNQIFNNVVAGQVITLEDRQFISENIDIVLTKMNDTVKLYETVRGLPNF